MKVLLTTDFSESSLIAFNYIRKFAKEASCEVTVVCVLEDVSSTNSPYTFASSVIDASGIMEQSEREAKQKLEQLCVKELPGIEHSFQVVISKSSVAETILSAAASLEIDLIVMASQGRSGFKKVLLGSIAEKVLRQSEVPVLLVPLK